MPTAGNVLTVREYQARWLDTYNEKLAATDGEAPTCAATDVTGEWALPLPREILTVQMLSAPHHSYPALDLMVAVGTPVYAIAGGRVDRVTNWNANWWEVGCGGSQPPKDCTRCGIGIAIRHPDGLRHPYCRNGRNHVTVGDQIAPGQHIADSGNTGRSGAPHLHLELRIDGQRGETHQPQSGVPTSVHHNQPGMHNPMTMIGIDPHKQSRHCGRDRRPRGGARRVHSPLLERSGGTAPRVGRPLRRMRVGGRVRERSRLPARAATRGCRRDCVRRSTGARVAGSGARLGPPCSTLLWSTPKSSGIGC